MSADEFIVLILCVVLSAVTLGRWAFACVAATRGPGCRSAATPVNTAMIVCLALLFVALRKFASHDVRDSAVYLVLYEIMGAAWLGVFMRLFPLVDLIPRDDALERGNRAAAWATAGACAGVTLCFAGANIGEGPGWWVVVYCAGMATGALVLLWWLVGRITGIMASVSVDRDRAAGLRVAGFLIGAGLILGRAAAGDWEGAGPAAADFLRIGWPAAALAGLAAAAEAFVSSFTDESEGAVLLLGVPLCAAYVAFGALVVHAQGAWS